MHRSAAKGSLKKHTFPHAAKEARAPLVSTGNRAPLFDQFLPRSGVDWQREHCVKHRSVYYIKASETPPPQTTTSRKQKFSVFFGGFTLLSYCKSFCFVKNVYVHFFFTFCLCCVGIKARRWELRKMLCEIIETFARTCGFRREGFGI